MAKPNEVTISFTGDVKDLNKAFSDVSNKLNGVSSQGESLGKSVGGAFGKMEGLASGSFSSIASSFTSLLVNPVTLGVAGIGAAVIAAFNFAKIGEENEKISKNFELFASQAGFNAGTLKEKISGIAEGFVDLEDVLPKAQEAIIALGKNAEKLPQIFELARNIGVTTGRDINDVFSELTKGIANGNEKMLRNNLIRIDSKKAEEDYAKSVNSSVERLTDAEKQQARLNAVLEQGKKNFGTLGDDAAPIQGGIRKIKLAFDDVSDAIAAIVNSKLGEYFASVISSAASGIKGLADSIKLMSGDLGNSGEQIARLEKHLVGLQKVQEGFFANPQMHAAYQKQIDDTIAKIEKLKTAQAAVPEKPVLQEGESTIGEDAAASRQQKSDATIAIEQQERATILQMETEHQAAMAQLALDNDATYQEKQDLLIENQVQKNAALYQNELDKNALIKDAQQRAAADELSRSKLVAANTKLIDDQKLADKKLIGQAEMQITDNIFSAAGILAAKDKEAAKAINIAQAIMNTYRGATLALATYPPPFGGIAAASTVALGLAQVSQIAGAKDGAFVTGGQSGVDTEPFMLAKGEIVAPEKSYDSVIDGELRSRGYVPASETEQLSILQQILTKLENPEIVIQAGVIVADDNGINELADKLRDAVRFRDASLT